MATDNILLAPSTPLVKEQNVVAQPQPEPKPQRRSQKFKQIQDSSESETPFHPGSIMSFGQSDPRGLLGSSGVSLQDHPKQETSMSRPVPTVLLLPDNHITKNKEGSAVTIKQETSMYRPVPTVLLLPDHRITKNKEASAVIIKCECLVPPLISGEYLRKGKQNLIEESFPHTYPQINVASQSPGASLMNGLCPSRVSQLNLLWLLQKQMQLSRTYEKRPEVVPNVRSIYTPEMCAQRLKQYMYRQQQRPRDNNIEFWSNLVAEFFAPNAKKRLCLSSNKHRQQISAIFPQEAWCCEICNGRPTAGFEMSAEVLPRLCKLKYDTGMMEEYLCLNIPEESYTPPGHIVLNYAKVTEQSVYEAARVVREGRLRIVFSSDLKICIWEFCCSFHKVYIDRRSVTSQCIKVHQLKEAIKKYQVFAEISSGIPTDESQRNSNKFASTVRELARTLDKSLINNLDYPKRYVRCLQISEIVSSMKDLMDYTKKYGTGPAEAMARIYRESAVSRVAHNSVAEEGPQQQLIDDAISQSSSVVSFAPYPSTDHEGTKSLKCSSPHATSPTSSTGSSKRLVDHQEDLVEAKRQKQMTNSGENSVLPDPTEPVFNQPISTTPPSSSSIRRSIVLPSVVVPSSTTSIELNEYLSSKVKVEEDPVTSQNLAVAEPDASIDTKLVLDQNENNGKYCYGFETDGASLFPGIHIGSHLTGTLMVNDTHGNNQQSNEHLPYLNGEMDPIDDIHFD